MRSFAEDDILAYLSESTALVEAAGALGGGLEPDGEEL
jgi:hypothetical protein